MRLAPSLDRLDAPDESAAERFRQALTLFEEGVELKRRNLKRQFPEDTPSELHVKLLRWLERKDET